LTQAAQKLLPELGVSVELLPAEEIECVPSFFCHPSLANSTEPPLSSPRRIATVQVFEYAPSCAIVGGILGQDVLNAIGGKEEPVRNFFVFEGATGQGRVRPLGV
jgi:ubiquitin-like 1-activating enzyme E1 A